MRERVCAYVHTCDAAWPADAPCERTETEVQTEKERDEERTRSETRGGRRRGHLTHINERLLSAFCVAMREQFAARRSFAPQSDDAKPRVDPRRIYVAVTQFLRYVSGHVINYKDALNELYKIDRVKTPIKRVIRSDLR